ncbi:MAG: LamG domain-containing protein [Proteobacteria bacterium]|nr:LamG domain-containing protein [Pseudomonadota bacterium]
MNRLPNLGVGVRVLRHVAVATLLASLAACTAGGPATSQTQQTTPGSSAASYTGPAAANADVQAFKVNLWENIRTSDKCGGCHHEGGQSPMFARSDDVNAAYQAANPLINFSQPDQSTLVLQVGSGHNCWVADAKACADTMLTWIKAWIGNSATSSTAVVLTPPTSTDVAGGKQFPTNETDGGTNSFYNTVYQDLRPFCKGCHAPDAASPQTPYFAQVDVHAAYLAAQDKINLNSPDQSRFVVRLGAEHHNCWTVNGPADCAGSAADMLAKIKQFANAITVQPIDPNLLLSKGLKLHDGTVASGGNRSEANLVAKYEFKTMTGTTAYDTSGVTPSADLMFTGDVSWVGGWGININMGGKAQATTATSAKIASMIQSTGEFSIEAWVAPANVAQTSAWVVSYSGSETTRNTTLGQAGMSWTASTRSDQTTANGNKTLDTTDATKFPVQAALQHLVMTYSPQDGQKIYVNGVDTKLKNNFPGGSLASWDNTFALVLGAETNGKDQWMGVIRFVAIHNRALTADQVMQNFNAGVGEKYFMLFDVTPLTGVPQSYVEVTASVLDNYSYLFTAPTFVSLNPNAVVSNVPLAGIRYGVNGQLQTSGQSWQMINTTLKANNQALSKVGGIVAADKGADTDLMFLAFDKIGSHSHPYSIPVGPVADPVFTGISPPLSGVKFYGQINAAMATITRVPASTPAVNTLYNSLQQSLPTTNDLSAFVASAQTAISQLADAYCTQAVSSKTLFPTVDLTQPAASYFGTTTPAGGSAQANNRALVITPLVNAVTGGAAVSPNPQATVITNALNTLINTLVVAPDNATTTQTVQGACSAVLGSAAVSLQ